MTPHSSSNKVKVAKVKVAKVKVAKVKVAYRFYAYSIFAIGVALTIGCGPQRTDPSKAISKAIQDAPPYYVLDEAHILPQEELTAFQSILIEHDRLTGEQFLIGIFQSLENQDIHDLSHKIFLKWRVGKRGQDNGILLTIFLAEKKAKIETGLGQASILTEPLAKEIADNIHLSLNPHSDSHKSLAEAVLRILSTLNSPLIQSGKADNYFQSLQSSNPSATEQPSNENETTIPSSLQRIWIVLLLGGIGMLAAILCHILSREAHFTSNGWYRPPFWKTYKILACRKLNRLKRKHETENHQQLGGTSGTW